MKTDETYAGFEQGPIRPPSEANSLLIRVTRNCPWNRCTFCALYKGTKFSLRPVDHVLQDIDQVRECVDFLSENGLGRSSGKRPERMDARALYAARNFIAGGMKSIFLQDGNSLILPPADFLAILRHLREAFPAVERITSYARAHTVARIGDNDLRAFAETGLNRIHIGMESGSDAVLKKVRKGIGKDTQIRAGQKIKRAGMELSEYFMPGLGGRALSEENARESADALNQINPDFIRLRTLALPGGAPLSAQYAAGEFDKMGDVETARELLLFLESLSGIHSRVRSDHILNLFREVEGTLPEDREKMTAPIREFLAMDPGEQVLFQVGRRSFNLSGLADLRNPARRAGAERSCRELGATPENVDAIVDSIIKGFI